MTNISIEMSDKDTILSNQMIVGESMFLIGHKIVINLIMFNMPNFDIIMGMDFLSCFGAEIN